MRIPNVLQNLLGEGVLSASFIPVYSKLLGEGDEDTAHRVAWTVGALLSLIASILVAAGILTTPYLIDAIAPGFHGAKRDLTIMLVRVLFPGVGLFVMSAWCLGILNSHSRFFISYTAPVAWNLAMIGALLIYGGHRSQAHLAITLAWASVVGAALQVAVQLPQTLRLIRALRIDLSRTIEPVKTVGKNFLPVVGSKGVYQISGYIDTLLASLLPTGAVAAFNYAQTLYMLPTSLFGMSVAAAELPSMSRATGSNEQVAGILQQRLNAGLRQIAFVVVPSAVVFAALGDVVAGVIYQSGRFTHADALYVWAVLAGSAVGLLAGTMGRLYNAAFYALLDTRTPLRFAIIRVILTTVLGYVCAIHLPAIIGIEQRWGVAGLTGSAGVAGWVEFVLLRSRLNRRVGWTGLEAGFQIRLWIMALTAAGVAFVAKPYLRVMGTRPGGLLVLMLFGLVYLGSAHWLQIPEARSFGNRLKALIRPRR
jgi:putative peptidoglycan lipid II flippase